MLIRFCVCVCVCVCVTIVRTGHTLAKIKTVKNDICRFCFLPSKIAFATLTYFLKLKHLNRWNVNISEMVWTSVKMRGTTFVDFDICHLMASLQNCTPWLWPIFWRSNMWNGNISEMVGSSLNMQWRVFVEFYICHRMAFMKKLYSENFPYFFRVKNETLNFDIWLQVVYMTPIWNCNPRY